jgi:purine nucleoside permease
VQVGDELPARFQQEGVNGTADFDRVEILRQEALQERGRVGSGHDHEITVDAGEMVLAICESAYALAADNGSVSKIVTSSPSWASGTPARSIVV